MNLQIGHDLRFFAAEGVRWRLRFPVLLPKVPIEVQFADLPVLNVAKLVTWRGELWSHGQ
jgi:hypothetical protein